MRRGKILMTAKWLILLGLTLLLLVTFISCADPISGVRIDNDEDPDKPPDEADPDEEGGGQRIALSNLPILLA